MDVIVRLSNVMRRFGNYRAVDDIELDILEGEFFSLLGPSGSGKTTLLRIIGGFERLDSGSILIGDRDMRGVPPERRPVNTVFQSYALFPTMSVFENVAYGLRVARVGREEIKRRVNAALDLVHMADFAGRSVTTLSGGQTQRVALARAIVLEPRVLLLDEPLGALDLKLRQVMQVEFKAIQKRLGITFIYVTHDQEEALTMSDRIGVMNSGRLEQVGPPIDIYRNPSTAFVAAFVGNTNLIEPRRDPRGIPILNGVPILTPIGDGPDRVWSIRPERVAVGAAATTQRQKVEARIEGMVFLGSLVRYHLRIGEGPHAMRIIAVASSASEMLVEGTTTQAGWSPDDIVALQP